jgi:transcriptional regulator GlxA family with amidase domain
MDSRIRRAIDLIDANSHTPILATDLCKTVGISHSRFRSLFKQEAGVSFREYLSRRRLKEAATLLVTTDLSITEICFRVGWSDLSNFEKTPTEPSPYSPP